MGCEKKNVAVFLRRPPSDREPHPLLQDMQLSANAQKEASDDVAERLALLGQKTNSLSFFSAALALFEASHALSGKDATFLSAANMKLKLGRVAEARTAYNELLASHTLRCIFAAHGFFLGGQVALRSVFWAIHHHYGSTV